MIRNNYIIRPSVGQHKGLFVRIFQSIFEMQDWLWKSIGNPLTHSVLRSATIHTNRSPTVPLHKPILATTSNFQNLAASRESWRLAGKLFPMLSVLQLNMSLAVEGTVFWAWSYLMAKTMHGFPEVVWLMVHQCWLDNLINRNSGKAEGVEGSRPFFAPPPR